eukprot:gene12969-12790_t
MQRQNSLQCLLQKFCTCSEAGLEAITLMHGLYAALSFPSASTTTFRGHDFHPDDASLHTLGLVGAMNRVASTKPAATRRMGARSTRPSVCVRTALVTPPSKMLKAQDSNFSAKVMEEEKKYVLQTYGRIPVVMAHGQGARVWDTEGKEYIDLAAGIAVNALGHSDPRWLKAVTEQAAVLAHTSNLYHTVPQVELAKRLVENSFADKVFFCNSGTEANEGAIKFARKWARVNAGIDAYDPNATAPFELVSFSSSFHGRTMGALALTYKEQYKTPFLPVMPGAIMATFNDLESTKKAIKKGVTAAVFVEPVQGEGGIHPASKEFLQLLRKLCDEAGALLVFDEVQCGLGRTGKLWGYENFGVEPDIMTVAKPLAGGLPIGAVLMKQHVADAMKPGDHGSTFAGNPLVCHAACAVFDVVNEPSFLTAVGDKGERLKAALAKHMSGNKHVKDIRGSGLLVGVELDIPAGPVTEVAREMGVLLITAGAGNVLRMVPPLVLTNEDIDSAALIVAQALDKHAATL